MMTFRIYRISNTEAQTSELISLRLLIRKKIPISLQFEMIYNWIGYKKVSKLQKFENIYWFCENNLKKIVSVSFCDWAFIWYSIDNTKVAWFEWINVSIMWNNRHGHYQVSFVFHNDFPKHNWEKLKAISKNDFRLQVKVMILQVAFLLAFQTFSKMCMSKKTFLSVMFLKVIF